jgi:hypothetical protein
MDDLKEKISKIVFQAENTIRWKTPTSIFIGLSPMKMTTVCKEDEKGAYAMSKVFNPTEHRYQDEKLRKNKILGVVLRGDNMYGWASQPYKLEKKIGEFSLQPKIYRFNATVTPTKSILHEVHVLMTSLLQNIDKRTRIKSLYDKSHLYQLQKIVDGKEDRVPKALNRLFHNSKCVQDFAVVCRLYGGGNQRIAMTFRDLSAIHGINEIPEQWGNGSTTISKETEMMLVGCEIGPDGSLKYIRLFAKDIPTYE